MAEAVLQHSRSSGASRASGARRRNGLALRTLAWQAVWRGRFEQAEDYAHRAIARLKGEGAESAIADAYSILTVVHFSRGRRDLARDYLQLGFDALKEQDNLSTRIDLLVAKGSWMLFGRRIQDSQKYINQALALSAGADRARVEQSIARAMCQDHRPGEALEHAFRSVHLCKEHNNRVVLPYALELAASALIDLERHDQAIMLINEANQLAAEAQDRRVECHLLYQMARARRKLNETDKASVLAENGVEILDVMRYYDWKPKFLLLLAQLQEEQGRTGDALQSLKSLVAIREAQQE
jgi:tetratricopeptide (TPR) repeat protein